jgi:magnesium transporter
MRKTGDSQKKAVRSRSTARLVRVSRNLSRKQGVPPGTLVHVGERAAEAVRVSVLEYDRTVCTERKDLSVQDLENLKPGAESVWISVEGLHDLEITAALGTRYQLHPLVLEDIVNTTQRPKVEDCGDYLFIVIKMLHFKDDTAEMSSEQISLVLGTNFLITLRELHGAEFEDVKQLIVTAKGRARTSGVDFLAYCLLDSVVDHYFVILEKLAEKIEFLEEEVVTNLSQDTLHAIHTLKTDMIFLRRSIWPLREITSRLTDRNTTLIADSTLPYLRDLYDHTIHAIDMLETYRDVVSGLLDIYLSGMSHRLNEIMKVLTIIATIFIPLTFMTGWYGMNFKNMPEYGWGWGYPIFIVLALSVASTMIIYFWRKKWL